MTNFAKIKEGTQAAYDLKAAAWHDGRVAQAGEAYWLEWLLKDLPQGAEVLDLGCGSGVIAIAARMLGAKKCRGMDFDPQAVKVARRNITRNDVDQVEFTETDVLQWQPQQRWSVVVANMFSTIIQQAFPTIIRAMEQDTDLIISGILKDQWDETKMIAEENGLTFQQITQKGKWTTARGRLKS